MDVKDEKVRGMDVKEGIEGGMDIMDGKVGGMYCIGRRTEKAVGGLRTV
jgi:hypothetical protein